MSWWVSLESDGKPVRVPRFQEGGTQVLGGSDEAALNVTYNYSKHYHRHLDQKEGLRWLHGRQASNAIGGLESTVNELGIRRDGNYWEASPGNAGYALWILLQWAKANPEAIFVVN